MLSITLNCKGSGINKLVAFYTKEEGRISAFVHPPFLAVAEPFTLSRLYVFSAKDSFFVKNARILHPFLNLKKDEKKIHLAFFVTDTVEKAGGKDYRIFNLLYNTLSLIEKGGEKALLSAFIIKLCDFLGILPSLSLCVNCRREVDEELLHFSIKEGGILCRECVRGKKCKILKRETLNFLKKLLFLSTRQVIDYEVEKEAEEAFSISLQHLIYHIGAKPAFSHVL